MVCPQDCLYTSEFLRVRDFFWSTYGLLLTAWQHLPGVYAQQMSITCSLVQVKHVILIYTLSRLCIGKFIQLWYIFVHYQQLFLRPSVPSSWEGPNTAEDPNFLRPALLLIKNSISASVLFCCVELYVNLKLNQLIFCFVIDILIHTT